MIGVEYMDDDYCGEYVDGITDSSESDYFN